MVRQPVEILDRLGVDRFRSGQRADETLGAPRHGAGEVEARGGGGVAGQHERVERLECHSAACLSQGSI